MNVVLQTRDRTLLSLSAEEMAALLNALNEVCHGNCIAESDFQTRLGVGRQQLIHLYEELLAQPHPARCVTEAADVWADHGSVMVRAVTAYGDPVELGDVEARAFSSALARAIEQAR